MECILDSQLGTVTNKQFTVNIYRGSDEKVRIEGMKYARAVQFSLSFAMVQENTVQYWSKRMKIWLSDL